LKLHIPATDYHRYYFSHQPRLFVFVLISSFFGATFLSWFRGSTRLDFYRLGFCSLGP